MPIYTLGEKQPQFNAEKVFIAPSADIIGDVTLGTGANIWFGAVLRGDDNTITIGENSNIQDNVVVHVDARHPVCVGNNVTVGHRAMIHGCTLHDNTLIGIGATVLDGAIIGKNTLIGAHTLVGEGKEIPEGVLVLGAPARVVRPLTQEQIQYLALSARHYVEKAQMFKAGLSGSA